MTNKKVKVKVLDDSDIDVTQMRKDILSKIEGIITIPEDDKAKYDEPEDDSESVTIDDTEDSISLDELNESLSSEYDDDEDDIDDDNEITGQPVKMQATKEYKIKRKDRNKAKKEMGIRRGKQSKYSTRSYSFLQDHHTAIHLVMCSDSEIYRDGADICPRILLGKAAFNKPSKKNAFVRLKEAQETFIEHMSGKNPQWIIISYDTAMIVDRNIVTRLQSLRETTHVVAPYGTNTVRSSGKWWRAEAAQELRGTYIQASMDDLSWSYRVGSDLTRSDRYQVIIGHGPFIAVRYETFMEMDFTYMADNVKDGFQHFMPHISMEAYARGKMTAVVNTPCIQYDSLDRHLDDDNFSLDHMVFLNQWKQHLPAGLR